MESSGENSALARAQAIQASLREIVLQTAYALRSRTQLSKLGVPHDYSFGIVSGADEAATSLEPLGAECAKYLALVRGLRDYLLHAQASLSIELERTQRREMEEAKKAAEEAERAAKAAAEEAEAKAKEQASKTLESASAADAVKSVPSGPHPSENGPGDGDSSGKGKVKETAGANDQSNASALDAEMVESISTPPLPSAGFKAPADAEMADGSTESVGPGNSDLQKGQPGTTQLEPSTSGTAETSGGHATNAIVIESDDDDDDLPLAMVPKNGSAEPVDVQTLQIGQNSTGSIDLTGDDSPPMALSKPLPSVEPSKEVASALSSFMQEEKAGAGSAKAQSETDNEIGSDLFGDGEESVAASEIKVGGAEDEIKSKETPGSVSAKKGTSPPPTDRNDDETKGNPSNSSSLESNPPNGAGTTAGTLDESNAAVLAGTSAGNTSSGAAPSTTSMGSGSGLDFQNMDLSSLGIDFSSFSGLPSFNSGSLAGSQDPSNALVPNQGGGAGLGGLEDFPGLGGMAGEVGGDGGGGGDGSGGSTNDWSSSLQGVDLSNFDFSSFGSNNMGPGGEGGDVGEAGGEVDLSALLESFANKPPAS
ncbi:hypothetical protein IE53DRAFT_410525 [Violaceomyces palustris]|uniref:Uncharacterized protein n=1 Tax=Violaceomyces palustris TaxID=1673888 RepID=A0ACD0NYI6_9BASI|nr:hypothetical protein IE53DRAFT_410525 [Violaceomyces palustris]